MSVTVKRQLTFSKNYACLAIYPVACTPELLFQITRLFHVEQVVTYLDDLTQAEFIQLAEHVNRSASFLNDISFDTDAQAFLSTPTVAYDILTWVMKKYDNPPLESWGFIEARPVFSLQDYTQRDNTKFSNTLALINRHMSNIIWGIEVDENTIWIHMNSQVYHSIDTVKKLKTFFKR